jgi:hypothetical protein
MRGAIASTAEAAVLTNIDLSLFIHPPNYRQAILALKRTSLSL